MSGDTTEYIHNIKDTLSLRRNDTACGPRLPGCPTVCEIANRKRSWDCCVFRMRSREMSHLGFSCSARTVYLREGVEWKKSMDCWPLNKNKCAFQSSFKSWCRSVETDRQFCTSGICQCLEQQLGGERYWTGAWDKAASDTSVKVQTSSWPCGIKGKDTVCHASIPFGSWWLHFQSSFMLKCPEKQQKMAQVYGSLQPHGRIRSS